MTRFKDITFESNSLTGTNGADSSSGAGIAVTSSSPLKGTYSATITAASSYVQEDHTASDTVYVSFYIKPRTQLGTTARVMEMRDGSAAYLNVRVGNNNTFRLYNGSTQVGSSIAFTLNTTYRIGVQYTKGTGSNGIMRMYIATGDAAFSGTPDCEQTNGTHTAQISRLRIGAPVSDPQDCLIDDIRIDDSAMPGPSTVITNKSIGATITLVRKVTRRVNRPVKRTQSVTATRTRRVNKRLAGTITIVRKIVRRVNKRISRTQSIARILTRRVNKRLSRTISLLKVVKRKVTRSIQRTQSVIAKVTRIPKKVVRATRSVLALVKRRVNKRRIASNTSLAFVKKRANRLVFATKSAIALLKRQVQIRRKAIQTSSAFRYGLPLKHLVASLTLARRVQRRLNKRVSATVFALALFRSILKKNAHANVAVVASLLRKNALLIRATITTLQKIVRSLSKRMRTVIAFAHSLVKRVTFYRSAGVTLSATVIARNSITLFIQATLGTTAHLIRRLQIIKIRTLTLLPQIHKYISRLMQAIITTLAIARKSLHLFVRGFVSSIARVSMRVQKTVRASAHATATLWRKATFLLGDTVNTQSRTYKKIQRYILRPVTVLTFIRRESDKVIYAVASLTITGAIVRTIRQYRKALQATYLSMRKRLNKHIQRSMQLLVVSSKRLSKLLRVMESIASSIARVAIKTMYVLVQQFITPYILRSIKKRIRSTVGFVRVYRRMVSKRTPLIIYTQSRIYKTLPRYLRATVTLVGHVFSAILRFSTEIRDAIYGIISQVRFGGLLAEESKYAGEIQQNNTITGGLDEYTDL